MKFPARRTTHALPPGRVTRIDGFAAGAKVDQLGNGEVMKRFAVGLIALLIAGTSGLASAGAAQAEDVIAAGFIMDTSAEWHTTRLDNPNDVAVDDLGNVYVANTGGSSILIFAPDAGQNQAPKRVIAGNATTLDKPVSVAVGADGHVFVLNVSSEPGAEGSILEFAAGTTGGETDDAPIRAVAGARTGLSDSRALALDTNRNLYVVNGGGAGGSSVAVFESGAAGDVSPARTIAGPDTGLANPQGLAVDLAGAIYVSNQDTSSISVYAASAAGGATDIAPDRLISGGETRLNGPAGLALDNAGRIVVANRLANEVLVYSGNASGNVDPVRVLSGSNVWAGGAVGVGVGAGGWIFLACGTNIPYRINKYAPEPKVSNVSPAIGTAGGGTSVTLSGTDLSVKSISVGGATARITDRSATAVTFTTPAAPPAPGDHYGNFRSGPQDVVFTDNYNVTVTLTDGFTYIGAPQGVSATTAGRTGSSVSWDVPDTGTVPVAGYKVRAYRVDEYTPAAQMSTDTDSALATLSGLDRGSAYEFTVATLTDGVESPESVRSNVVLPGTSKPPSSNTGVTVNSGSNYTNTKSVDLNITWPAHAVSMRVSNDGGFLPGMTRTFDPAARVAWALDDSVSGLYTKIVYVRFEGYGIDPTRTYTDDIILDAKAPTIETARAQAGANVRGLERRSVKAKAKNRIVVISTKARDDKSGVSRIQVARKTSGAGSVSAKYKAKLRTTQPKRLTKLYVRVQDRANNWSRWKAIKIK